MAHPSKFGKYEVLGLIGRGGMGAVYKARDTVLGRLVALKVMNAGLIDTDEVRERFLREALAVASLQHRNIVVIFDLGEDQETPFIVMEYLDGQPLDSIIRDRTPLTVPQKVGIIIQVAQALQHAHERAIIHRDVKPANIMLMGDSTVKVVDFGIAHFADQTMTRTGLVLGTISYMSPEQLNGKSVDARTDIFSLGVVCYQLLTGKLPFEGASTAETIAKIMIDPPPPLTNLGEVSPPALQSILDKALAKQKEQRYQACSEVAAALGHLLIHAPYPLPATKIWDTPGRGGIGLEANIKQQAADCGSVQAGSSPLFEPQPSVIHPSIKAAARQPLGSPKSLIPKWMTIVAVSLLTLIFVLAGLYQATRTKLPVGMDQSLADLYRHAVRGNSQMMAQLGAHYAAGEGVPQNYAEALRWYSKAADAGNADAMNSIGEMYGSGRGVAKSYRRAVTWFRKAADAGNATAMYSLGNLYRDGYGGLEQDYGQAASWYRKAADASNPDAMNSLAILYQSGQGVESDVHQAVIWYRKAADSGNTDAMQRLGDGYAYGWLGPKDFKQGLAWFQMAVDRGNADSMLGLCDLHRNGQEKDYKESNYWCRKAADLLRKSALTGDARSMSKLGDLYRDGNGVEIDKKEALSWYRKAAEAGDPDAMQNVGYMYVKGSVVAKDDEQGYFWWRRADGAQRAGAADPLVYLCVYHAGHAEEEKQEEQRRVSAFRQTAEHSSLEAMLNLGYLYQTACSKDPKQAYYWYDKAAQSGSAEGMFHLGALYEIGDGVPQSRDQAISWYRQSAQLGEQYAKDALNRLGEDP